MSFDDRNLARLELKDVVNDLILPAFVKINSLPVVLRRRRPEEPRI